MMMLFSGRRDANSASFCPERMQRRVGVGGISGKPQTYSKANRKGEFAGASLTWSRSFFFGFFLELVVDMKLGWVVVAAVVVVVVGR